MSEIEFLVLIRDKIDLLIPKVSLYEQLYEISVLIGDRIKQLEEEAEEIV